LLHDWKKQSQSSLSRNSLIALPFVGRNNNNNSSSNDFECAS